MNKNRRKELRDFIMELTNVKNELESLKDKLETIQSDEQDYLDAIPENLQSGINAMNSEEAIDKMDDVLSAIDDAISAIEEII